MPDFPPIAYAICTNAKHHQKTTKHKIYEIFHYNYKIFQSLPWHSGFILINTDQKRYEYISACCFMIFKTFEQAETFQKSINFENIQKRLTKVEEETQLLKSLINANTSLLQKKYEK